MNHRKIVLLIAVFMVFYFGVSPAISVPAAPDVHTLKQKDGSTFMATLWGDEWSHGWETTDGYSIIFDETTQDWTYAMPGADGNLLPSTNVVGRDAPPDNVPEHLIPTGKAQLKILNLKASMAPGVPDRAVPATGTANIPVILINFNDTSTNYTAANFNALLFGSGTKSMKDYYEEVSYGKFSVSSGPGGVAGWYTASKNHDYYGQNDALGKDRWPGTLVREAMTAADPTFNFAPYDKDSDCYVDVVDIIHQGSGEETSGSSTDIWSKSWDLYSANYFGYSDGGIYTTNDACPAGGFIKINAFVIQPETLEGGQSTMGVFAHEYGHALGLPDLYDYTSTSAGIGDWSLMAYGTWNGISRQGDTPAHLDAWSKSLLGWVSPTQVSTSSVTQIKRVEDNSVVYQLLDNSNGVTDWTRTGIGKGEYFLVENRQKTGFDAALPGEGLLIWHIDESIGNNNDYTHKLVDLEEADGLNHLDNKINYGDAFDPWYNSVVGFTEATSPNSKLYNGSVSGVRVTNIGASATIMTATLVGGAAPIPPVANFTGTPTSGTAPLTVTFTDSSTNTPTSWNWSFGDGNYSTSQNPVKTYAFNGTFTVSLNATNSAGSDTKTRSNYITVSSGVVAPVANFTGTPTSGTAPLTAQFTDTSTGSLISWNRSFGDGDTTNSTVQNPIHTYTSAGTYTVSLTATNAGGSNISLKTNYIAVTGQAVLVFSVAPNSRSAQTGTPVTAFISVINGGTATASHVSLTQASSLPVSVSYQQWNGVTSIGSPNTPVDIPASGMANFILTITPNAAFSSSPLTFNVSGTNINAAPISAVNTLTMRATTTSPADVIMSVTGTMDYRIEVNVTTVPFAVSTTNVGVNATGVNFNIVVPSSITGLAYHVNETWPANGTIKSPATGLTINHLDQPTFAVSLTPTQPIMMDLVNNRITLQLVDGSGNVIGAQSVAVSTT